MENLHFIRRTGYNVLGRDILHKGTFLYSMISIFKDTHSRWVFTPKYTPFFFVDKGSIASVPSLILFQYASQKLILKRFLESPLQVIFIWTYPLLSQLKLIAVMNRGQVWHKWHGRSLKVCERMYCWTLPK